MRKLSILVLLTGLSPLLVSADTFKTVTLQADLSPSSETPPITQDAAGDAKIALHMHWDTDGKLVSAIVDFNMHYELGEANQIVGMHIHKGLEGIPGPVLISSGIPQTSAQAGSNRIFIQANVTDADLLKAVEDIAANPGGYYVNMHSPDHPGGFIRGQLRSADFSDDISTINSLVQALARKAGILAPTN